MDAYPGFHSFLLYISSVTYGSVYVPSCPAHLTCQAPRHVYYAEQFQAWGHRATTTSQLVTWSCRHTVNSAPAIAGQRAERLLRPHHSRDSHLESWQACPGMPICWMHAVVWMRVIMRRCVGWLWNVWRQQNLLMAWVRQQQHAVVSLQWTDEIWGRPQSMRKLQLTGPR